MSTFTMISLLQLLGLLSFSFCIGSIAAANIDSIVRNQQKQPTTPAASTSRTRRRRRRRNLAKLRDGPSSTEIDCSLSSSNYEYYIERCYDETTQWWINGHCIDGIKDEVSELHRCVRTGGSRPYCHDCHDPKSGIMKHICGSDTPDKEEACGIAHTSSTKGSTAKDCDGGEQVTAYSHQCIMYNNLAQPATSSWYLREHYVCEGNTMDLVPTTPDSFECGQEWYYDFAKDEHESGEEHPFANEGNAFCLDCGLAIQVCASDEDATCESLGLDNPTIGGDVVGEAVDAKNSDKGIAPLDNNDVNKSDEDSPDVMNEEVDQSDSTKTTEETDNTQESEGGLATGEKDEVDDVNTEKNNESAAPLYDDDVKTGLGEGPAVTTEEVDQSDSAKTTEETDNTQESKEDPVMGGDYVGEAVATENTSKGIVQLDNDNVKTSVEEGSDVTNEEVDQSDSAKATDETESEEDPIMGGNDYGEATATENNNKGNAPLDGDDDVTKIVEEVNDAMNEEVDLSDSTETMEETHNTQESKEELTKEANQSDISTSLEQEESVSGVESSEYYPNNHRSAWVTHGAVGAFTFGVLAPFAILITRRDPKYHHWINCIRGCINILTFAMAIFTVAKAISTMNGMGEEGEGHLKEMHHITGLLLLLYVCFQTASGCFFRSPVPVQQPQTATTESTTKKERNYTPSLSLMMWLFVFALGAYQVQSGLALFSKRYGTADLGKVYIGYIICLAILMLVVDLWMTWKEAKMKYWDDNVNMEGIEISSGEAAQFGGTETGPLNW